MMRFSPSTGGGYPETINYGAALPADVVEVPDATWFALVSEANSTGQVIVAGPGGQPVLSAAPAPTVAALVAQLNIQAVAALAESDKTILRCFEHGVTVPAAWTAYRATLRTQVTATTGDPSALPSRPPYPSGT